MLTYPQECFAASGQLGKDAQDGLLTGVLSGASRLDRRRSVVAYIGPMEIATSTVMNFTLRDDGIIWAESQPGIEPTEMLLEEAESACRRLRRTTRRAAIWDIRRLERPKPDAWVRFIEGAPNNLLAIAVVGEPEHIKLLGSFPGLIDSLLIPFRLFTDEASALEWLRQFV